MNKEMSNKISRRYFLHSSDRDKDDNIVCYFSGNGLSKDSWGFWVDANGTVECDDETSNGKMPPEDIVKDCVTAAKKYLKNDL